MSETRQQVYENAAGLLCRMGYAARMEPGHRLAWEPQPVTALVTDAPPVVVGYAVAMVAEDPEAHLPEASAKVGRAAPGKAGDPQTAWWAD
ncbi:MAG: hypothetical protein KFF45_04545 [Thioalkalivibrio sp.]|nr:hypothetical protein [Thioalkalivibrio sp.]